MTYLPWRKIHTALFGDVRYLGLSPFAKLVFLTLQALTAADNLTTAQTLTAIRAITGLEGKAVQHSIDELLFVGLVVDHRVLTTVELYEQPKIKTDTATTTESPEERRRRLDRERKKLKRGKSDVPQVSAADVPQESADMSADVPQTFRGQNADMSADIPQTLPQTFRGQNADMSADIPQTLPQTFRGNSADKSIHLDKETEENTEKDKNTDSLSNGAREGDSQKNLTLSNAEPTQKPTRSRRTKAQVTDPVPPEGTLARRVYDAIAGSSRLASIMVNLGAFALSVTDKDTYPGVDVLAEIKRAEGWLADNNETRKNGNVYLRGWLQRAVSRAPVQTIPVVKSREDQLNHPSMTGKRGRLMVPVTEEQQAILDDAARKAREGWEDEE